MRVILVGGLAVTVMLVAAAALQSQDVEGALVRAAHEDDTRAVQALLAAGANVNQRGALGATALMHAAAFGSIETMQALLDVGADVTAAADDGATALTWATADVAKVHLLIDRGAPVDAASADGTTAAISAARRGALESLRVLIAEGALDDLSDAEQAVLLTAAYSSSELDARQVLAEAGLVARDIAQVVGASFSLGSRTLEGLQEFLDLGLDPDSTRPFVTIQIPLLGFAATGGQVDLVRVLLERGADPNKTATGGTTPLMMAAARDRVDVVQALIDGGAPLDATDAGGRSALDWALTRGDTPVIRLLRERGVEATARPAAAPGAVVTQPRPAGDAMARAIELLEPISPAFREHNTCISCHNQSIPALAMVAARDAGISVDAMMAAHADDATLEAWETTIGQNLAGECSGGGFVPNTTYGLLAMTASGQPRTLATDARVACLAGRQEADGSWTVGDVRPPLGGTALVFTVLSARALDTFAPPGLRPQMRQRIERALAFIRRAEAHDTQEAAFKLMGLVWLDGTPAEIAAQTDVLLALQREGGGWGQEPAMAPDAYATGQALYALQVAGVAPSHDAYRAGTAYLLRTQREDGSWFVRSRGFPFQPYADYGFPHGTDQFISGVATSWAVMALSAAR